MASGIGDASSGGLEGEERGKELRLCWFDLYMLGTTGPVFAVS